MKSLTSPIAFTPVPIPFPIEPVRLNTRPL